MSEAGIRKLDDFLSAIEKDAERESESIQEEIEKRREAYLSAADDDILAEIFVYVRRKTTGIRAAEGKRIAEAVFKNRRELFESRERLLDGVVKEACTKLQTYTTTPDYQNTLQKSLEYGCLTLLTDTPLVFLREKDLTLFKTISGARALTIQADAGIRLGGMILETPDQCRRLDLSFDAALHEARAGFVALSGFGGLERTGGKSPL